MSFVVDAQVLSSLNSNNSCKIRLKRTGYNWLELGCLCLSLAYVELQHCNFYDHFYRREIIGWGHKQDGQSFGYGRYKVKGKQVTVISLVSNRLCYHHI